MGRLSLFIFQALLTTELWARTIEEVKLPETFKSTGKEIPLQGVGLRTATIFNIRVYLAAFYSEAAPKRQDDVNLLKRPLILDVTYLRDFSGEDVDKAWKFQFEDSSQYPYPEMKEHVKNIQDFYGDIKGDRKETFELVDGETRFYENGTLKGKILGEAFQKNFLSLFFGKKPPTEDLKKGLLNEIKL
jgi:Chalcone isomerase-like